MASMATCRNGASTAFDKERREHVTIEVGPELPAVGHDTHVRIRDRIRHDLPARAAPGVPQCER